MRITVISDTHTKHGLIPLTDLPGGDLLIHAGDIMNSGYNKNDIHDFCTWFNSLNQYKDKVFIAGNHDRMFENHSLEANIIVNNYSNVIYLQDDDFVIYGDGPEGNSPEDNIRIYGLPHTPEFYNWAFNIPRNSHQMQEIVNKIPKNLDILITHGPAFGYLDTVEGRRHENLGCELLVERIKLIKPKIHICGHIHSGRGYKFDGNTHFFNASVLDEQYQYTQKPWNFEWQKETNSINFL
jgi:Icc-related predicted phosphoesterase